MTLDSVSTDLPTIVPAGDQAINVEFGAEIDDLVNDQVYALADALSEKPPEWMQELVPTYRSLLIRYDALRHDFDTVAAELRGRIVANEGVPDSADPKRARVVYELPTTYGGEYGPDLEAVADHNQVSAAEVIRIHSGTAYRVYMIGFSPGFPYLGGMDSQIACPRLSTPRTRVPAGSVGIAESQTGVYPTASPGGWRIIGRTPIRLFDHTKSPPSVLQPGHFVRFVPVESKEFAEIEREVESGEFQIKSAELVG